MKYMAIIDADEKPVSCEFIGCNGNVTPYLIGTTTNIKELDQEPILDKISAEIKQYQSDYDVRGTEYDRTAWKAFNRCLQIIDKYKAESER